MKWSITSTCYSNFIKTLELEWSRCHNNDWYNWIWANRFDKLLVGIRSKLNGNTTENKFKFSKNTPPLPKTPQKTLTHHVNFRSLEFISLRNKVHFVCFARMIRLMTSLKKLSFLFYRKIYPVNRNCFARLFVKNTFKYWFY